MALVRVNPADWAVGDKFTSAQANGIDENVVKALDKTTAGDTLSGDVTVASTGGLAFASGSSLATASGSSVSIATGTTVACSLSTSSSVTFGTGSTLSVGSGATVTCTLGATGAITVGSGGNITTASGGSVTWNATDWPKLNARTRFRYSKPGFLVSWGKTATDSGGWDCDNAVGNILGGASNYALPLSLPMHNGGTLYNITLWFTPAAHVALPAAAPGLIIRKWLPSSGAIVSTQSFIYTLPGTVGAYSSTRQQWEIVLSPSMVIDEAYMYTVTLTDENSTNSVAGTVYDAISFAYSNITDMRFP